VEQAFLKLKSGASHNCALAEPGSLQTLLTSLGDPPQSGASMLKLRLSQGGTLDVPVGEIASVEIPSPFCVVRDFLSPGEMYGVLEHALRHAHTFGDATVSLPATQGDSQPDYGLRRSNISDYIAPLTPVLVPRLQAMIPRVWPHLHLPPMTFQKIEFEVAAHGDGGFFRIHTDSGLPDIAHRRVSCVYYFHREPRQFSGGQLRVYSTLIENGVRRCGTRFVDIEPPRNGLIVFPSDCYHEVTPIRCASSALEDQRLSVNIWFCGQ
jgi:Rps23 Pro-64 3,4-dihydroxylase Tpa1-like proline 4-hydroxylase